VRDPGLERENLSIAIVARSAQIRCCATVKRP
jgi:hypothetical protein